VELAVTDSQIDMFLPDLTPPAVPASSPMTFVTWLAVVKVGRPHIRTLVASNTASSNLPIIG
jgi:hypothetical protein